MKMYRVEIKGFSNKVYKLDNIQDILDEIKIFTNIENIVSIQKVEEKINEEWPWFINRI
jgi:hypothetical protein